MVNERSVWNVEEATKSDKPTESEPEKKHTGSIKQGMVNVIRAIWTMLCFVVFCGFSFFLGWHLRGWHFSAYYEAPNVDLVGAKAAYSAPSPVPTTTLPPAKQISQVEPEPEQ